MSKLSEVPLLIGEVFVDFTLTPAGQENKLRLGGIVHAARGLWAAGREYDIAAVLPSYLEPITRKYLKDFGCREFFVIGDVVGAPNLTTILDVREVGDQGYDTPLRDEKVVTLDCTPLAGRQFENVIIFPGLYDLRAVCETLPTEARLHLDIAYDLEQTSILAELPQSIESILISTSSPLFLSLQIQSIEGLREVLHTSGTRHIVLKHNRGGSQVWERATGNIVALGAQLGTTVNSVGVGDVFAAIFATYLSEGAESAGWKATFAASVYSQTTYPADIKDDIQRYFRLAPDVLSNLGGVVLPWEARPALPIYFAAPDFSTAERTAIEAALSALSYHNFTVRRPIVENEELPAGSELPLLQTTFRKDWALIQNCKLMFAVPTHRDPGTLVEIGIAIERGMPVVTFDPGHDANNTMVIAGSRCYSDDLDSCLNAVFQILAKAR